MHRALILTSQYAPNSGYPNHPDWQQAAALFSVLSARDYAASPLVSGPGLVEVLRQQLRESNAHQSLLVYFSGYVILTDSGEPALLLADGEVAPLRVSQLVTRMGASFGRVLLVVDGVLGSAPGQVPLVDGQAPEATVCGMTLECVDVDNVGALVCVRPWNTFLAHQGAGGEPFTSAFLRGLRALGERASAVDSVQLMEWLSEQQVLGHLGLSETDPNFMLLPQRKYPSNPAGVLIPTRILSVGDAEEAERDEWQTHASPELGLETADPHFDEPPEESEIRLRSAATPVPEAAVSEIDESDNDEGYADDESAIFAEEPHVTTTPPNRPLVALEAPVSWRPGTFAIPEPEDEAELVKRARDAADAGEENEALEHAVRCLKLFPKSVAAVQIAANLMAKLDRWDALAQLYEQLLLGQSDTDGQVKLRVALSRIYSAKLENPGRALELIEAASELKPKDAALHLEAAALCETEEHLEAAEAHYRAALRLEPLVLQPYRRAAAFFSWAGDADTAWNAAAILAYLGEATEHETELVESQRAVLLPQPSRALAEADFACGLSAAPTDPALATLMGIVAPKARAALYGSKKSRDAELQGLVQIEVGHSTTTLASSLVWTCQLLSVPIPSLYLTDREGVVRPLRVDEPSWEVSRGLGRGVKAQELVFCWARSLVLSRAENQLSLVCQSREELLSVLEACALLGVQDPGAISMTSSGKQAANLLKQRLTPEELGAIGEIMRTIPHDRLSARVDAWLTQLVFIQNRVGLVACGDPGLAARTLERLADTSLVTRTAQLEDLFSFAVGESYARLRATLGLSLNHPAAAE